MLLSRLEAAALVALILVVGAPSRAITLGDFDVPFARVGDTVELSATDLDPQETYTLTVGGSPATITLTEIDRLRFIVPPGAEAGRVELELPGTPPQRFESPQALTVTRLVDATIDPALGAGVAGYFVGSAVADSQGAGPVFPIDVPIGLPVLAIAAGSSAQSALLQIVTDSVANAELSAASTAQALVFSMPTVMSSDPVEAFRHAIGSVLGELLSVEQARDSQSGAPFSRTGSKANPS